MSLKESIPALLGEKGYLITTDCINSELRRRGENYLEESIFARKIQRIPCDHQKHVSEEKCILDLIQREKLIVAVDGDQFRSTLRNIAGVPIMYIKDCALRLEKPSNATNIKNKSQIKKKLNVDQNELIHLNKSLPVVDSAPSHPPPSFKKFSRATYEKTKKESRLKKKKKKWLEKLKLKKKTEKANPPTPEKKKRKRKRKPKDGESGGENKKQVVESN